MSARSIGRFTIEDTIGSGGYGIVYAAHDPRLDRKVAIKLLYADEVPEAKDALNREAKAMAQVVHANVVPIYELGLHEGHLFIAMGLVHGIDLRAWLGKVQRPWRQVLDVFIAAGRGLHAVHQAGLLHRDFKPDNVLVGEAGGVWLTDFGLARADSSWGGGSNANATGLRGTREYMAPERLRGESGDARSDVYSFCVALREGLRGTAPPRWLKRAIDGGLAAQPARRPKDMQALLARLQPNRTRRLIAAAMVVLACVALIVGYRAHTQCKRDAQSLLLTLHTENPQLAAALARFAEQFSISAAISCKKPESEALLQLQCLRQALYDVRAKVALLDSVEVIAKLPAPSDCLALQTALLPQDPQQRETIDAAYQELARARALNDADKKAEARAIASPLAARAAALGYAPLTAAVRYTVGNTYLWNSAVDAASAFKQAMLDAEGGHDDHIRAQVAIARASALTYLGRHEEGRDLLDQAEAILNRRLDDFEALSSLESVRAKIEQGLRNPQGGISHAEKALAYHQRWRGTSLASQTPLLTVLCTMQALAEHTEEALAACGKAREAITGLFGDTHWRLLIIDNGSSLALRAAHRFEEALPFSQHTVALAEKIYGPEHPMLIMLLVDNGAVLLGLGRAQEALTRLRRAQAIAEKTLGERHPEYVDTLYEQARVEIRLGHTQRAIALLRSAREHALQLEAKESYLKEIGEVEKLLPRTR